MTWPANARPATVLPFPDEGRHIFLIEMDAGPDALLRALGPFALHEATVTGLDLERRDGRQTLRVEAMGLRRELAARLGRKLEALPVVRTVGLGWRM
jgi:hypothetical protein